MRILVDENTAVQLIGPLRHLLPRHEVVHITDIGWSGKKDRPLLRDAGRRTYEVFLTRDSNQLNDPEECRAIKASGLHHVRYEQRKTGLAGLALALGAVIAAMPAVMAELEAADGQRLVHIVSLDPGRRRFEAIDPARDPPRYWPGNPGASRSRRR
jgi:PIN like domain